MADPATLPVPWTRGRSSLACLTPVNDGQVAFLGHGDVVEFSAPEDAAGPADLLLLAGVPLEEPVVRWGPFVMNTSQQIRAAVDDYHAGRMGAIAH